MTEQISRTPSDLDARADSYVRDVARLNPLAATDWGLPGDPGTLPDYSPAGQEEMLDLARALVTDAQRIAPADDVDRITASAITESLGAEIDLEEADEWLGSVNNIASPIQDIRMSFDLMEKESAEDWGQVARRMHAVPTALAGYQESLRLAASRGRIAARRQIGIGIEQSRGLADSGNYFAELAEEGIALVNGNAALEQELRAGAAEAAAAYGKLADMLAAELLDRAPTADGIGRERYARFSRASIGAVVDLDETYEWGLSQLAEIDAQQRAIATELYGAGTSVREALDRLNDEPDLQLHGTEALREWMQGIADRAISDLDGTQFDIPAPARRIECMIAPSQDGGIYYTGPSQDFSRPGRMWWAVPEGETTFHTWQERTTVFHEGVPGHHLQIGTAVANAADLNLWRRQISWSSGHGEGWALYAEQLMAEFGFLDDPGDRFGLLDSQRLRATRVVLDIGLHLGKPALPEFGTGPWDADSTWRLLKANVNMDEGFLRFEHLRYLGWPGQAPSYAIGRRLWLQLRDAATAAGTPLKHFHARALALGSIPLSVLTEVFTR